MAILQQAAFEIYEYRQLVEALKSRETSNQRQDTEP